MSDEFTTLTLVQAPGIPEIERKALESHWREAVLDPDYTVVLNYECRVDLIDVRPGYNVLVQAPGIPASEVRKLRSKVNKALKAKKQVDRVVVLNYECRIDAVPAP
jgi:hypothetical protein